MKALTPLPNRHVLVIDDNRSIHEDFRKILGTDAQAGDKLADIEAELFGDDAPPEPAAAEAFHIDSAYQGQEALQMIQNAVAAEQPYAMAFVDVRMPPGWDGIETVDHIWKVYPDL
ncbi:MAG: GGDEF domain-containing response regulator, partial [Verrucomicrobiota bacterium]